MANIKAVGIDLGTTNSAVAWVDETGRSVMVPNSEGDLLTPSVVLFGDAEIVVGKDARSATTASPDQVAERVKRDMGAPVYSHPIRGESLPPEVIQACILRKLRVDVARKLGPDTKVVITVPAYFDEPRRKATADAGEMAGLEVLDIVNEPTAAALAFSEILGYLSATGAPEGEITVLVYDLGGGTFDATLLRLSPNDIRTLATDGDVELGGHDWDMRLVDHVAESFRKETSHGVDLREDPAALNRLLRAVIEAKHTLSARTRATIQVHCDGLDGQFQVTRAQFEEMTADLLERTAYTARQLLAAAALGWNDISRVLLVGGSTRMPMVAAMLQQLSGITPDRTVNPDEAVARGAALYAGYLLASGAPGGSRATFQVTNVNAHGLGIEGIEPTTMRKTNVVLIPRNTALPAKFTEKFITKSEGQRSIVIQVLQGESTLPGDCTAIGRTVIRDLPTGLPKGWPVEVSFEYGVNGRLSVRAAVPGTHSEMLLELERDAGLSFEGITRWKHIVDGASGFGTLREELSGEQGLMGPAATSGPVAEKGITAARTETEPQPIAPAAGPQPVSETLPPAGTQPPAYQSQPPAYQSQPPAYQSQPGVYQSQPGVYQSQPGVMGTQPGSGPDPRQAAAGAPMGSAPGERAAEADAPPPTAPRKRLPKWTVYVVGYVSSAVVGLGAGYLILVLVQRYLLRR